MTLRKRPLPGFLLGMAVVLALASLPAFSQDKATITGSVTDPAGSVVPNVTITVTNTATGLVRETTSSDSGNYTFSNLGIGTLNLKATSPGFKAYAQESIQLNVNDTVKVDVHLEIGSEAQTVNVQANALEVQSQSSEVSSLITSKQIATLAMNSRNVVSLAALGLGVSGNLPDNNIPTSVGSNFSISFNGARNQHNLWMLDGGEDSDRGGGGGMAIMPSPDSLAEFQTLSSNYSADYGISSGGTITMALKSGGHDFHGGAWEFLRNDVFDANNYFNKQTTPVTPAPELRENIFGGNIGGPVFIPHIYNADRKRTFFFYNEEWRRIIQGSQPTLLNTIPAADFPNAGADLTYVNPSGKFSPILVPTTVDPARLALYAASGLTPGKAFPGNVIPASLIDQNAVLFMGTGAFPKPNTGLASVSLSAKQPIYVREDLLRMDHNVTDKWHLMGHYVHDAVNQTYATSLWSNDSYPTVGTVFGNPSYSAVIKLTGTITPTLLNETSFNYDGNIIKIQPTGIYQQPAGMSLQKYFPGNDPTNRLPEIDLGAPYGTNYSTASWPWHNAAQDYNPKDDLSWTHGKHSFKFGGGYMRYTKNQEIFGQTQGVYGFTNNQSGDSYVNFLLGVTSSYSELQQQDVRHYVNNTISFYGIDNWKVLPQLTLNLGLRYDAMPHAWERNNRLGNFLPGAYNPGLGYPLLADGTIDPTNGGVTTPAGASEPFYTNGLQIAGSAGVPRGLVDNYYKTLQPRIGFAYDVFGDGKTAIRGGFGIFFERVQGNDVYNAAPNPPFAYTPSSTNVYFSNPHQSSNTGATATLPFFPSSLTTLPAAYPAPGTSNFSLGVQREMARSVIAVVQYVGSVGWHQNNDRAINTLPLLDANGGFATRKGVANGSLNSNLFRQFPGYGGVTVQENSTNVSYNSLQAGVRMDARYGVTFEAAYTYSHEIDQVSSEFANVSNPFNTAYDRGSGQLDRRQIFNLNYVWNIPLLQHSSNGVLKSLLGNWQLSGIMIAQTGIPFIPSYGTDVLGLGGGTTNRPNLVKKVAYAKKQTAWFDSSAFAAPAAPWEAGYTGGQGFGSAGKDSIRGPGRVNFNTSLFKTFPLKSDNGPRFEFRVDSFNTFNHTQFNNLDTGFTDSNFGRATGTQDPRALQLAAKFLF